MWLCSSHSGNSGARTPSNLQLCNSVRKPGTVCARHAFVAVTVLFSELVADRGATVGSGRLDVALKQDYVEAANEIDDEQALDILQGWNGTVRHYPSFAAVDKIFRHLLRRTEGDMWWIGDRYCETASVLLYRVVDEPERGVEFFLGVDSKGSYAPLGGWSARGVDRSLAETAAREANEETFGYLQDNDLVGPLVELMQSQPGDRRCLIYHEGTKNAMYAVNFDPQFRVDEMLALRQERSCRGNSPPEHFRELHASPPTRFWDECSAWEWVSAEEVFNGDKRMENAIAESVQSDGIRQFVADLLAGNDPALANEQFGVAGAAANPGGGRGGHRGRGGWRGGQGRGANERGGQGRGFNARGGGPPGGNRGGPGHRGDRGGGPGGHRGDRGNWSRGGSQRGGSQRGGGRGGW
eukprot:TRINITY_DN2961_c0_g1_i3.p2 TRINITY_DN2961_c0_g1~~TRINITY_DN2961_c0_g1_i3.p2  ORF type:complete len:410 (+),score=26.84 TRINITY_DN2961_c0_g1_i3:89-1318(+)